MLSTAAPGVVNSSATSTSASASRTPDPFAASSRPIDTTTSAACYAATARTSLPIFPAPKSAIRRVVTPPPSARPLGSPEIRTPKGQGLRYIYANGVVLHHAEKTQDGQGVNGVVFVGTDGKVEVNRGHIKTWPEEIGKTQLGDGDVHLYRSPGHRQDWINCIRTRQRPICDVAVGASSVTVCHLGNIAYWIGRGFKWDPQKQEIIGDQAASRWLDRPKRGTWRL
jgi:hypothetical protein